MTETVTFFDPHGVVNVTVKLPRVLFRDFTVKLAVPPEVTVLKAGEIPRLEAVVVAVIVPEKPVLRETTKVPVPPLLRTERDVGATVIVHAGVGVGVGVGNGVG